MFDVFAFFIVVTVLTVAAAMVVLWDVRRRLRRSFERSTERALDDLAADTCDDLAGGAKDSRAVRRYEAVRDEAARAKGVTDLGKVAARAEVRRYVSRADAGLRTARRKLSSATSSVAVERRRSEDREQRSTRR